MAEIRTESRPGEGDELAFLELIRRLVDGEVVEALSRERPLLLVLEDLHWADGATVDLLAWLARRREPVACSSR